MREVLNLTGKREILNLISEVVYMQKPYWGDITERQLKLSVIRPRKVSLCADKESRPLLVFLCGGAFQEMDRNVWMAELCYFAEHGFVVACVEYSVLPDTEFPEQLVEIKAAIRFLRAHREKYGIKKDGTVVMGESAGGYLAALTAATNGDYHYEQGDYMEESSKVDLAVLLYPLTKVEPMPFIRVSIENFPDICERVTEDMVPVYLLHGTGDQLVECEHSIRLYERLKAYGISDKLTLIEGAHHADARFFKTEVKERILKFMEEYLSGQGKAKNEIERLNLATDNHMTGLTSDVVYMQKPYWCNVSGRQMKLSIMRPRVYYPYDERKEYPLLVFLCGGAFEKVNRNVWVPELCYFAMHGFVVACVEYSVLPYTEYPETLEEIKTAIRFLRTYREEFCIQNQRVVIAGEGAGGYLAALTAASNGDPRYDIGDYLEESSEVQRAVCIYPTARIQMLNTSGLHVRIENYPDICDLITKNTVPMYLIHGEQDAQVPCQQSVCLYDKLQECGVRDSWLTLIEGAEHRDSLCFQTEIKERILKFVKES